MTMEYQNALIELRFAVPHKKPLVGCATRECVAWRDGDPIDRFTLVLWTWSGEWMAWCCDTCSAYLKGLRRAAAAALSLSNAQILLPIP